MKSILTLLVTGAALAVAPFIVNAQLLSEHFNYSDGEINTVSSGAWAVQAAGTPFNVANGAAVINQGDLTQGREHVSHALSTPFTTAGNSAAYYAFTATWSALPLTATGSYFLNLSVSTTATTPFYGRVGADLDGAAGGKFRISVANANWTQANSIEFPLDLSLGVAYSVVVRYDLNTRDTTLWVNPTSESSTSVTATDAPVGTQQAIAAINLRPGLSGGNTGAPGVIHLNDLLVGTTFSQVSAVPEPEEYAAVFAACLAGFALGRRRTHSRR